MECKFCAAEIAEENEYCPVCGKSFAADDTGYMEIAAKSAKKRKRRIIISVVAGILSFIFAVTTITGIIITFLIGAGIITTGAGIGVGILGYFGISEVINSEKEDETTTAVDNSHIVYVNKADTFLKAKNYDAALATILNAEQLFGQKSEIVAKKKEILTEKGLAELVAFEANKDYKGALNYINYNLSEVASEPSIVEKKSFYSEAYRTHLLAEAETAFVSGDALKAINIIKDGLLILPGDILLEEKYAYYKSNSEEGIDNPENIPVTKNEIIEFYADAVNRVEIGKEAGFTMKEWEHIDSIESGNSTVDKLIITGLNAFMTKEEDAEQITFGKGDEGMIEEFPDWYLTDYTMVKDAVCNVNSGGNYEITITMHEEDTPTADSILEQVTETVLIWEKIEDLLLNDSKVKAILTYYEDVHIYYRNFTITAEITPDGQLVYLEHVADIDAYIGKAEIAGMFTMTNKTGHMWHYCQYFDFTY